jgi:ribose 5-phosphate isomerase B
MSIEPKLLFIASDHAGLELKKHLMTRFPTLPWEDLGTNNSDSVDYPDYAQKLAEKMKSQGQETIGVLVCGSGQGMCIKANRYSHIRAALCWDEEVAKLAREHNNANVLCLGGRLIPFPVAEKILTSFLNSDFQGGRHQSRVDKL